MGLPSLALVHGGQQGGDCCRPSIERRHQLDPKLKILNRDLPGHCGKSSDLSAACLGDWIDSVVSAMTGEVPRARILTGRGSSPFGQTAA